MKTLAMVLVMCTIAMATPAVAQTLTYVDLVSRLTDLEALATLPRPGEACVQWSSYDRASRYDQTAGKYVAWDANGDGGHVIREENGGLVFAEMNGPGCIWRIWSARPGAGHVRIWLDGAEVPAVDLPFAGYFNGENEPFTRPALVHETAKGWNSYVPIPYQESCRIVADPGWGAYYHFTYGTFPPGTRVPTFSRDLSPEEDAALDAADKRLRGEVPFDVPAGVTTHTKTVKLRPAKRAVVAQLDGPRAVTGIRLKILDLPESPEDRRVLRELALAIYWDGETEPSVWSPLGDFFGTAAGANAYDSLPLGLAEDGWWYCRWYMPFSRSARIELVNDGAKRRSVAYKIDHAPLERPIGEFGRFHAKWHRDAFLPTEPERSIDWTLVDTVGRGRFCGVMLHIWNPRGGWWGEGDEKFHVDGEKFPSTIGTGSEDYFGYAWGNPTLFENAYHNQTISMKNKGHISVNRWQITDNVPFQRSFQGYIEKYFPNDRPTLYAATAYWYLAPGGRDPYAPAPVAERTDYCDWGGTTAQTYMVKGAIEGEELKVIAKTGGNVATQQMGSFAGEWSGEAQLWWTGAAPTDRANLALPVAVTGDYRVVMRFTRAVDYGVVRVSLDGQTLRSPIDLYNLAVTPFGPFDMGTRRLDAGSHTLTLEIVGANEDAVKAYMVGLDYVKLESVR